MNNKTNGIKNKKKLTKPRIALIVIASILLVSVIAVYIFANSLLSRIDYRRDTDATPTVFSEDEITPEPEDMVTQDPDGTPLPTGSEEEPEESSKAPTFNNNPSSNKDIYNVLLIGIDRRSSNENGRSDTMIIASFDKKNKKLKMTSLMRDTYVYIPGNYRNNRLNASFAYGNAPLLMKTINSNFNLNIDKYVVVDFEMFTDIIERIGDVKVNLTASEATVLFGTNKPAGDYELNPDETLRFTRLRKIGNDFQRTGRQRRVLESIYNKGISMKILELTSVLYDVLPHVETNLTKMQILTLATDVLTMGRKPIEELQIPYKNAYKSQKIRGMSVLVPDIQANAKKINEFIYE